MTLLDAYESFLRNVDKFQVSAITIPDFLHYFHLARKDYLAERLSQMERTGSIDDALSDFYKVKEYPLPVLDTPLPKPDDYHRMALMQCVFSHTVICRGKQVTAEVTRKMARLTADKEGFILENPYYEPSIDRWYYKQMGGRFHLYGDPSVKLLKVLATYFPELPLYTAKDVGSQVGLPFSFSQMATLSEKAATLFLEVKESARVRTQPLVQQTGSV